MNENDLNSAATSAVLRPNGRFLSAGFSLFPKFASFKSRTSLTSECVTSRTLRLGSGLVQFIFVFAVEELGRWRFEGTVD